MIVQIVLVIVTAVHVYSQELCPSVCQCDGVNANCMNLFSDVTETTQIKFRSELRVLNVYGTTNLEKGGDRFLHWNITSLTALDLSRNNIKKIWSGSFSRLTDLQFLFLYDNSITSLHSQTFLSNKYLAVLSLAKNNITVIEPSTFQSNIILRDLDLSRNKIFSIHQQTFVANVNLVWLDLGNNFISEILSSTFEKASQLTDLNLSGNKIDFIAPDTFIANVELQWLNLNDNDITDIHSSTFRTNSKLSGLQISGNKLSSIRPRTFANNGQLEWLNLERNRITDISLLTFRNNTILRHLDLSDNEITSIIPGTFIRNNELTFLYLKSNKISEISNTAFQGLEKLEQLDLSENNIADLNPLVFHNTLTSRSLLTNQVSSLKHINLARNKIGDLKLETYFPMGSNSDTFSPTFNLQYLNVSSNKLTTLDVKSVEWLNYTNALMDLTENPWNCDCSVLLEVWRVLRHKLSLQCVSPRGLHGRSWDATEIFCSNLAKDMKNKSITSTETVSPIPENMEEREMPNNGEYPSAITIVLIVVAVLLVCAIGGGLILAKVLKRQRNRPKISKRFDIYPQRPQYVSYHSYAEVGSGAPFVSVASYADAGPDNSYATGYPYASVK